MSIDDLAAEQAYLSTLYDRLDRLRERAEHRLATTLREPGGTPQQRSERDAAATRYAEQLSQLRAAELGLCFGRLDLASGDRHYIGRLGMFDETADYAPLLIDWRAPAARLFYVATPAAPQGVLRRRHLRTDQRQVVELYDEPLDLTAADPDQPAQPADAALLAALSANRTGRMADIVATIQAEQDQIIRAEHHGVLVVDGGPGTGKTAVALHRAAYLLYTHREQLSQRGVLVVGPNPTFLRYIDQVLPSLGETGVLLATVGQLFPGVTATATEPAAVAQLKGRPELAELVAAAVRDRQALPEPGREFLLSDSHAGLGYQRTTVTMDGAACQRARAKARRTGRPHNQARPIFVRELLRALAQQLADRLGDDPYAGDSLGGNDAPGEGVSLLDAADVAAIAAELRTDPHLLAALDELWPRLTPQQLLTELYASPQRLTTATAAAGLGEAEAALLYREPGSPWTAADVPLLDEAAELLGDPDPTPERSGPAPVNEPDRLEYAQGVLDIATGSRPTGDDDRDELAISDLFTADQLAGRQEVREVSTIAQQAASDRRWTFGHVIVDEAQELSAMAWRMLMRRCPSRSMTLVGDLAQTGDPAGTGSWEAALAPYVGDRWRLAQLTVNYRTPAEIMELAGRVAGSIDPPPRLPRSVRRTGVRPWREPVAAGSLVSALPGMVAREAAELAGGRLAVIVPAGRLAELGRAVTTALPRAACGPDPAALAAPVAVLTVRAAKGLEFDSVIVVEPTQLVADSPRGINDLYVALTRPTRRLGIVHSDQLPGFLTSSGERPAGGSDSAVER